MCESFEKLMKADLRGLSLVNTARPTDVRAVVEHYPEPGVYGIGFMVPEQGTNSVLSPRREKVPNLGADEEN